MFIALGNASRQLMFVVKVKYLTIFLPLFKGMSQQFRSNVLDVITFFRLCHEMLQ